MKKNKTFINELIEEGNKFSFENNKKYNSNQHYSKATPEFLAWVSKVEDYISSNFDESSGPYKMLNSVQKIKFSGYYQSEFETEFNKLKGAINSCLSLNPNKKHQENQILSLIKNPLFWTVIVILMSASYKLGHDNGLAKFDIEKIEMNRLNNIYADSISKFKKEIKNLNKEFKTIKINHLTK